MKFKQAVTTDDAGQDGSARYWKTPRKEKTAHNRFQDKENTGCFIMFSMITNIYNKKTKGHTLLEMFTATGKMEKVFFWQLEMFDVCATGDAAHIDTILKSTWWCVCGNNLNIVSMCAASPVVHTSNISSCQKKLFQFCGNSIKVGPLFSCYKCL